MLEQCYSLSKRCRNDVVKLCCAKNSSLQIASCKITFKQRRQRRQREGKKQQIYISKTTTLHEHHSFLHISLPLLHDCDMKRPNFLRPLRSWWTQHTLGYGPFGFNPREFCQHLTNQMKLNCELWTVRNASKWRFNQKCCYRGNVT